MFTEFKSMLSQTAEARRIAPMVVEYVEEDTGPHTLFSFEPDATTLFESLLPRYVATRIFAALLEAAASESASRRRAMKAASDNADDLIKALTLMANRGSGRLRSPRKSAKSSAAQTLSPTPNRPTQKSSGAKKHDCHR